MDDIVTKIAQTIRSQRKDLGLKLVEAAALCGVGTRFFSELENGKTTLQLGKVIQVMRALGLSLEVHRTFDPDRDSLHEIQKRPGKTRNKSSY